MLTASIDHHREKYIKTVKAMNKATAEAYNCRLGYFDSFVSNDYRISLDDMVSIILIFPPSAALLEPCPFLP
jgi:hypothetical protein